MVIWTRQIGHLLPAHGQTLRMKKATGRPALLAVAAKARATSVLPVPALHRLGQTYPL